MALTATATATITTTIEMYPPHASYVVELVDPPWPVQFT